MDQETFFCQVQGHFENAGLHEDVRYPHLQLPLWPLSLHFRYLNLGLFFLIVRRDYGGRKKNGQWVVISCLLSPQLALTYLKSHAAYNVVSLLLPGVGLQYVSSFYVLSAL